MIYIVYNELVYDKRAGYRCRRRLCSGGGPGDFSGGFILTLGAPLVTPLVSRAGRRLPPRPGDPGKGAGWEERKVRLSIRARDVLCSPRDWSTCGCYIRGVTFERAIWDYTFGFALFWVPIAGKPS